MSFHSSSDLGHVHGPDLPPPPPLYHLPKQGLWYTGLEAPPELATLPPSRNPLDKKSKKEKHSKHRSKRHKKHRSKKQEYGAYILQLIGVLCLVLAALRSFEPLAGVGFTLVVIGYDRKQLGKGPLAGEFVTAVTNGVGGDGKSKGKEKKRRKLKDEHDDSEDDLERKQAQVEF